jgi:hypothetical protein
MVNVANLIGVDYSCVMFTCTKFQIPKPANCFYERKSRRTLSAECKECFKDRMSHRHQQHKDILVAEFGGQCSRCGYSRCSRVLHFHHTDPSNKSFGIAEKLSSNLELLREEAKKCILLCPLCHEEKHQGIW